MVSKMGFIQALFSPFWQKNVPFNFRAYFRPILKPNFCPLIVLTKKYISQPMFGSKSQPIFGSSNQSIFGSNWQTFLGQVAKPFFGQIVISLRGQVVSSVMVK